MNALLASTGLSTQQLTIVNAVLQTRGSINVKARAGCGKTHLIIHGICKAIYERQPRAEVVGMAYNKAAGDELKARAEAAGLTDWRRVQFGTCHSFGFAAFRKLAPNVRVDEQKVKKIIEGIAGGAKENPLHPYILMSGAIQDAVSLAKQRGFGFLVPVGDRSAWYDLIDHFGIEDDLPENFPVDDLVDMSIDVLNRSIAQDFEVIDFADMIIAPLIHKARFWGKDIVIVDEGQDTNPARRALALAMLKPRYGRLIVVGDDRQAIYGFTGADGDAMDLIAKQMGSTTYPLTVTRRCPKAVVELARRIVPDFTAHPDAPEGVVREIPYSRQVRKQLTVEPGDLYAPDLVMQAWFETENLQYGDAILCRNTRPLVDQAYALIRAGIGCMVEGRAIGKGLIALATKWSRIKTLSALAGKLEEYREKETTKWLAKGREEKADAIEDKVGTLQTIITKLINEGRGQVADLIADVDKLFGDANDDKAPKVVRLCSGHRSKGREWRRVFHLGRARFLPSTYARKDWQLQQEENLEYVMITRAMEEYVDVVMEAA